MGTFHCMLSAAGFLLAVLQAGLLLQSMDCLFSREGAGIEDAREWLCYSVVALGGALPAALVAWLLLK